MPPNSINLIRDRAERPRTTLEKISLAVPVGLLFAYALTLGLALIMIRSTNRQAVILERKIERIKADPEPHQEPAYDREVIENIKVLEEKVGQHEKRWEWSEILSILRKHIPEHVFLTSFSGQSNKRLQFRGHAKDADGEAMDRVRNLVVALESDPRFMEKFEDVIWQSSQSVEGEESDILEFDIMCPASED